MTTAAIEDHGWIWNATSCWILLFFFIFSLHISLFHWHIAREGPTGWQAEPLSEMRSRCFKIWDRAFTWQPCFASQLCLVSLSIPRTPLNCYFSMGYRWYSDKWIIVVIFGIGVKATKFNLSCNWRLSKWLMYYFCEIGLFWLQPMRCCLSITCVHYRH